MQSISVVLVVLRMHASHHLCRSMLNMDSIKYYLFCCGFVCPISSLFGICIPICIPRECMLIKFHAPTVDHHFSVNVKEFVYHGSFSRAFCIPKVYARTGSWCKFAWTSLVIMHMHTCCATEGL